MRRASRPELLNSAFHRTIYAAAHMPRLSAMIGQLQDSSQVYIRIFSLTVRRGSEDPEERMGIAEHEAIYLACAARAPEAAAQATVVHLQHTLDVVRRELRSQRTAGLPAAGILPKQTSPPSPRPFRHRFTSSPRAGAVRVQGHEQARHRSLPRAFKGELSFRAACE